MPRLTNARHELVAHALAMGDSAVDACRKAGYSADRGNASRTTAKNSIQARVKELQVEAANAVREDLKMTAEKITTMMLEDRKLAQEGKVPEGNAAASITKDIGRLWGHSFAEAPAQPGVPATKPTVNDLAPDFGAWRRKEFGSKEKDKGANGGLPN